MTIVYDSGPVPLVVRLLVLPFVPLALVALYGTAVAHDACGFLACGALLYFFVGTWRFRNRLVRCDDGELRQIHQGIVFRWTRRIRREALGGVRVRTRRTTFGGGLVEIEVFTADGRSWYGTPPQVPEEAPGLAAEMARALGLPAP